MTDAADSSSALSPEAVRRVAHLCRLAITDDEVADSATRMTAIFQYIDRLSELDLTGVEPLNNPLDATNRVDADELRPGLPTAALMAMAPAADPPFVKVPKVLGDPGA